MTAGTRIFNILIRLPFTVPTRPCAPLGESAARASTGEETDQTDQTDQTDHTDRTDDDLDDFMALLVPSVHPFTPFDPFAVHRSNSTGAEIFLFKSRNVPPMRAVKSLGVSTATIPQLPQFGSCPLCGSLAVLCVSAAFLQFGPGVRNRELLAIHPSIDISPVVSYDIS